VESGKWKIESEATRKFLRICFLCFALSIFHFQLSTAQQVTLKKADIPRIPVDTLPTDREGVRIVTFTDGTFRFIPENIYRFLSAKTYDNHWDTLNLFAYHDIELHDLPRRVTIEMAESHGYHAPATGSILSKYGPRGRRAHNGIDIRVTHGQPIFAAFDGMVRFSRWNSGGYGNLVIIRHASGLETYYAHLSRRAVVAGEWVRAGQVIGYGGRTGRASTNHLHFEVRYSDQSFDPERIIDFERGTLHQREFVLNKDYFSIRSRAVEGLGRNADGELSYAETLDGETIASLDSLAVADGVDSLSVASAEPAPPAAPEPLYHKIRSGDTLLALALHYGTTVAKICSLNGITPTTILRLGRTLRIK
jgi:LysM repeat protein/ribosomal protein L27